MLSWIVGVFFTGIVCLIAFPIGMIGYALNQGISKHLQINTAIDKAKREGHYIEWNKVKDYRKLANSDLQSGFIGMGIMAVIYFIVLIFAPKFFVLSLFGLAPFGLGLLGAFMIPKINPF